MPDFGVTEADPLRTRKAADTHSEFDQSFKGSARAADSEYFEIEILEDKRQGPARKKADLSEFSTKEFNEVGNLLTNVEEYSKRIRDDVDRYARQVREEVDLLKSEIELELANVLIEKKNAERKGREIIKSAEDSRDEILTTGREEGYQAGFEEGKQQHKEDNDQLTNSVMELIKELQNLRIQVYRDHEQQIVRLATLIAKKVVHNELTTQRDFVTSMLKDIMKHFEGLGTISIRVNPVEYEFVKEHQQEIAAFLENEQIVKVKPDSNVQAGSTIVESDFSSVNLEFNKQFEEVEIRLNDCFEDRKELFQPVNV